MVGVVTDLSLPRTSRWPEDGEQEDLKRRQIPSSTTDAALVPFHTISSLYNPRFVKVESPLNFTFYFSFIIRMTRTFFFFRFRTHRNWRVGQAVSPRTISSSEKRASNTRAIRC
jgi:hypothetical protein